ncbi:hypothetical protein GUJ93_ZPchr0004g40276, partial [Zizania palustris]
MAAHGDSTTSVNVVEACCDLCMWLSDELLKARHTSLEKCKKAKNVSSVDMASVDAAGEKHQ